MLVARTGSGHSTWPSPLPKGSFQMGLDLGPWGPGLWLPVTSPQSLGQPRDPGKLPAPPLGSVQATKGTWT